MPDDAAVEKQHELEARGACVERVRPVAISNPQHMVHQARQAASPASVDEHSAAALQPANRCFFADQFENTDNAEAHVATGEELWTQCGGHVHAFVCGAGTGGTIAGVSAALKKRKKDVRIVLVDPPGSSLYLKVCMLVMHVVHGTVRAHIPAVNAAPYVRVAAPYVLLECWWMCHIAE